MQQKEKTGSKLQKSIEATKNIDYGGFSKDAKRALLHDAHQAVQEPNPGRTPWIWVLAGTAAAVCVLALWVAQPRFNQPATPVQVATKIEVLKTGNHVVFNLQNGGTVHTVKASNDPANFDASVETKVDDGSFVDRLDRGADITFYRIE